MSPLLNSCMVADDLSDVTQLWWEAFDETEKKLINILNMNGTWMTPLGEVLCLFVMSFCGVKQACDQRTESMVSESIMCACSQLQWCSGHDVTPKNRDHMNTEYRLCEWQKIIFMNQYSVLAILVTCVTLMQKNFMQLSSIYASVCRFSQLNRFCISLWHLKVQY